MHNLCSLCKP